jgi:hypothetical protein
MSTLSEITAELRTKDAEKTAIADEITKIEELKESGSVGKVKLTVQEVKTIQVDALVLTLEPDTNSMGTKDILQGVETELQINSKDTKVLVTATAQVDEAQADVSEIVNASKYTTSIDCSIIPGSTYLLSEFEGFDEEGKKATFAIKASYSSLDELMESKMTEMKEVNGRMEELRVALQELQSNKTKAKAKSDTAKGTQKVVKKTTGKKTTAAKKSEEPKTISEKINAGINFAMGNAGAVAMLALEYRAVPMFVVSAGIIYFYGEAMSV